MTRAAAGGGAIEPIVAALERLYGRPPLPPARGPFEMVLWENVAYLQTDERRERAFRALKKTAGSTPRRLLAAPAEAMLEVARLGGMQPERRAQTLRAIAELAMGAFGGDLDAAVSADPSGAVKALRRFPGIGAPGAEKILVFAGIRPALALDSNGLRVLLRLGFGRQRGSYEATYRDAQQAAASALPARRREDCAWLARAHLLLRRHGKELCRTSAPRCAICPLLERCPFGAAAAR